MSTHLEIDLMIAQLEEKLPTWATVYPEQQFLRMLSEALNYIAASGSRCPRTLRDAHWMLGPQ
ncbi:hypothetical protein ORG27_03125 [Stenotrophomonas lactitubi]|uniref:hypothetical protein n=1 Tax=Stenotrophomonas lactitubi TaxID=2045214 RepID=UPI002249A198|nr:hypothetical protein [Stenotrophomonas lactitubi]MCX2892568.1 hypothetical protein [Stenotrophomonas lactitubi]